MDNRQNNPQQHKPQQRRMGPPGMMGPGGGEKAKNFKATMKQLLAYVKKHLPLIIVAIIFAIGSTIFNIVGPKILGQATTKLFEGLISKISGGSGIDFDAIGKILIMLLGIYVISAVFMYVQAYIMTGVTQKITYKLRKEISQKINVLPMKYFDKRTHGEVLSRVTNDIDTLQQGLNQSVTQCITSITTLIGILIMMLSISWQMTLVSLLILPITVLLVGGVVKKSQVHFKNQQKYLGRVNGQVEEVYGGHNIVKAFNGEENALEEFNKDNEKLYEAGWKSQFLSGIMMPAMTFVGNLSYVGIALLGGVLVVNGTLQVGYIQSFIQYSRQFTQPISQLAQISNLMQSMAASAERVFEFLNEEEEEETKNPIKLKDENGNITLNGTVDFKNVHFGYVEDKIIINDFSCHVKDGQKIAIVGPTGAGKTTVIKLLMRFYELNAGSILIDGKNITDFKRSDIRQMFGMVLQETWLFNGSIKDNIRYSRLDATDEEVINACKAAHVHHFVKTLPNGYDMELNEEASNVSGGQKQLLTIARAILADPKILILDEATSNVDTRTEGLIQKAMDNLMKGRTSFVIAHRLSTIRDADVILVMKDGDIIEQGNHDTLLEKNGFYASLYNSQFTK